MKHSMAEDPGRLDQLKELVSWARAKSPFYAKRLRSVNPNVAVEADLLYQLPILERNEVQPLSRSDNNPLFCVRPDEFVRFHHTSGSTGDGSLWVFDTASDWEAIVECWSVALNCFEIGPQDRALVCAGYGRFIGFWGLHDALIASEVLTVSGADADSKARATLIERLEITTVAATPTYALRLGNEIATSNVSSKVRLVVTSGEPRPLETRDRIERLWGCRSLDTAGMTETGTISMFECPHCPGNMHVLEDRFLEEVLNPVTREPAADGEMGVRVVTPLERRGMPFIRYWTNDLVVRERASCDCGIGAHVYRGGITGRLDHMVKVDGIWFLPSMLEGVARKFEELVEYRATLVRDENGRTVLELELEVYPETVSEDFPRLFADECKRSIGFRPRVELVTDLPRFEGKAKRFHDQRLPAVA